MRITTNKGTEYIEGLKSVNLEPGEVVEIYVGDIGLPLATAPHLVMTAARAEIARLRELLRKPAGSSL